MEKVHITIFRSTHFPIEHYFYNFSSADSVFADLVFSE